MFHILTLIYSFLLRLKKNSKWNHRKNLHLNKKICLGVGYQIDTTAVLGI